MCFLFFLRGEWVVWLGGGRRGVVVVGGLPSVLPWDENGGRFVVEVWMEMRPDMKDTRGRLRRRTPPSTHQTPHPTLRLTHRQPLRSPPLLAKRSSPSPVHPLLQRRHQPRSRSSCSFPPPFPPQQTPIFPFFFFLLAFPPNHSTTPPQIYTDTTIPLTTSSGIHGPQIAEWTLMTRLTQSHAYPAYYEAQKRHDWAPRPSRDHPPTRDLAGQRLGVLGYGAIGRQIARLAHAAGMTIIAYTASPRPTPASRRDTGYIVPGTGDPEGSLPAAWYSGASKRQLHDFLGASLDWLVVCLPLTPATTGLISTAEFSLLATRHAFISNISRGPILNQDALIAALKPTERGGTAWLRGAALDVTTPEPLPPSSELWGLDNVVVTPHISGLSEKYTQRYFDILRENLRRRERGEEEGLVNEVDRRRGY